MRLGVRYVEGSIQDLKRPLLPQKNLVGDLAGGIGGAAVTTAIEEPPEAQEFEELKEEKLNSMLGVISSREDIRPSIFCVLHKVGFCKSHRLNPRESQIMETIKL